MITPTEQRETLLALYPLFKREVYDRRDRMMVWTAVGAGSLMSLLLIVVLIPSPSLAATGSKPLLGIGTVALTSCFAIVLRQQYDRHRQAKQMLITLERTLGLFNDHGDASPSLYPKHWQSEWDQDRSFTAYLTILTVLTGLVLAALVLRS